MTADAFATVLPGHWGGMIVSMSIIFFAFSTILGWAYYGERCIVCLFGHRASLPYRMFFTAMVFVGATTELTIVWTFSDLANGLMALPNQIGLLLLSGLEDRDTKAYLRFDPRLTASPEAVKEHLAQQQITWR